MQGDLDAGVVGGPDAAAGSVADDADGSDMTSGSGGWEADEDVVDAGAGFEAVGYMGVGTVPGQSGSGWVRVAPRIGEHEPWHCGGGQVSFHQADLVRSGFGVEVSGQHRREVTSASGCDELGDGPDLQAADRRLAWGGVQLGGEKGTVPAGERIEANRIVRPSSWTSPAGSRASAVSAIGHLLSTALPMSTPCLPSRCCQRSGHGEAIHAQCIPSRSAIRPAALTSPTPQTSCRPQISGLASASTSWMACRRLCQLPKRHHRFQVTTRIDVSASRPSSCVVAEAPARAWVTPTRPWPPSQTPGWL